MCGIAGILTSPQESVSLETLHDMSRTLRHRGPDEEGYKTLEGAALGFRRLAIIDLSGGAQPMCNEDESLWLVFNGEIYNYRLLKIALEATGRHRFRTQSDTEVILHLYEEYAEHCVDHMRGMFAFAIWDRRRKKLFAARDRFGKKPFVYFRTPHGGLVFASELKALLRHPDCPQTVDLSSIYMYLGYQYIPSPRTILKDVFKLPPAHWLTWSVEEGVRRQRYWDLRYEPKEPLAYPEACERLRSALEESVKLRMISDVPLGAFLSGGIDSSIVTALMARQSSRPIQTFSIGFEEDHFSELPYAREVSQLYKTDHHEFIVKPELVDFLPTLAAAYPEPFGDSSALPTYFLAQMTRRHVTVALSGDGGDEQFGGYARYRDMWLLNRLGAVPAHVRSLLVRILSGSSLWFLNAATRRRLLRALGASAMPLLPRYYQTLYCVLPEDQEMLWQTGHVATFQAEGLNAVQLLENVVSDYKPEDWLDQLLYVDLHTYLPECLMVKVDIASMANSLEARSPFLDHVLAEECARWPSTWKFCPPGQSKKILKDTFARDLPAEILARKKQGFAIPVKDWFRGPLKGFLKEVLLSPKALQRNYFRKETLERFIDEHTRGIRDRSPGLWALVMLELWHDQIKK